MDDAGIWSCIGLDVHFLHAEHLPGCDELLSWRSQFLYQLCFLLTLVFQNAVLLSSLFLSLEQPTLDGLRCRWAEVGSRNFILSWFASSSLFPIEPFLSENQAFQLHEHFVPSSYFFGSSLTLSRHRKHNHADEDDVCFLFSSCSL